VNVGYTRSRVDPTGRRDLYHLSAVALSTINESWRVLLLDSRRTPMSMTRGPSGRRLVRIGAIYSIKKRVDIDFGYQGRLNRAAPSQVLLFGVTARWGP
jgi:hypothetical protein